MPLSLNCSFPAPLNVVFAKVGESVVFKPKSHLIVVGEFKSNEPNVKISISSLFAGAVVNVITVLLVFVKSVPSTSCTPFKNTNTGFVEVYLSVFEFVSAPLKAVVDPSPVYLYLSTIPVCSGGATPI